MKEYKIFFKNRSGNICRVEDFHAESDADLIDVLNNNVEHSGAEIWLGGRLIAIIGVDRVQDAEIS